MNRAKGIRWWFLACYYHIDEIHKHTHTHQINKKKSNAPKTTAIERETKKNASIHEFYFSINSGCMLSCVPNIVIMPHTQIGIK